MNLQEPLWFVLNHIGGPSKKIAQNTVDHFNEINNTSLELFAPTYVKREDKNGETKFRTVHLTFHYVFLRGTLLQVKHLCSEQNGFSFLLDHSSQNRYAIIDDRTMAHFKTITRAYKNCLPYFPLDDINLEDGDLVEVVKGDFPGLVGYFMPIPKSKSGNILLKVFNNVGTIAFNIKASEVRILQFSPHSTRANDQIDAFLPNLLLALRLFDTATPLPAKLAATLSMFCGRMDIANLSNKKLNARLQILLYAANYIIGNNENARRALEKFNKIKESVTNEWTNATNSLILSIISQSKQSLQPIYAKLKTLPVSSKTQKIVIDEYIHYIRP
ncbi:MAG: hypothetical protein K2H46_00200 [Muribaculaceae bacterium]|nr:hypothetical protein [Muribaculaceae bacterium]